MLQEYWPDIIFRRTVFRSYVSFKDASFRVPPNFEGAIFQGGANFEGIHLDLFALNFLFENAHFVGHSKLTVEPGPQRSTVTLRNCDLTGLEIAPLQAIGDSLEITGAAAWKRTFAMGELSRRIKIRDEVVLKGDSAKLVGTCQFLEAYFYRRSEYSLASQCHVGQLVARRKDADHERTTIVINWL